MRRHLPALLALPRPARSASASTSATLARFSSSRTLRSPSSPLSHAFSTSARSPMGVEKQTLKEGNGTKPKKGQKITVNCTGHLADGMRKFWSTQDPGQQPFTFVVGQGQVIRGWDEGFMQMSLGEKARLTMTGDYAYGAAGFPAWQIPPNATLVFDVEILSIQ